MKKTTTCSVIRKKPDLCHMHQCLAQYLDHRICQPIAQRILLASHEVLANLFRHTKQKASRIAIQFIISEEHYYCIISDDSTCFEKFSDKWQETYNHDISIFNSQVIGLHLVRRLWPDSFYVPKNQDINYFVLPLTYDPQVNLPDYFIPKALEEPFLSAEEKQALWVNLLTPLIGKVPLSC